RLLRNVPPSFAERAYSTLAEGLGQGVPNIESRMILSQIGYRLLLALLDGTAAEVWEGDLLEPYSPADLLVIGYGAGRSQARVNYPFERKIAEAHSRGH